MSNPSPGVQEKGSSIIEMASFLYDLLQNSPFLSDEFGKAEMPNKPANSTEAVILCVHTMNLIIKSHESYTQVTSKKDDGEKLDFNALQKSIKSVLPKINVTSMLKKTPTEFISSSSSSNPVPVYKQAKPPPIQTATGTTQTTRTTSLNRISNKVADLFGYDSSDNTEEKERKASFMTVEAQDDGTQDPEKKKLPKREAKLAKFFGLPESSSSIDVIRTELRFNSNLGFYKGCMGENVIRIYMGDSKFHHYKSLLISNETTSLESIKLLLAKLGIEDSPENFALVEVDKGEEHQLLPDDIPLERMSKWLGQESFRLKKIAEKEYVEEETAFITFNPRPSPGKNLAKKGKLADFFGVGLADIENLGIQKALDQLEPSGTFFDITEPSKGEEALSLTDLVSLRIETEDKTIHRLHVTSMATASQAVSLFATKVGVSPRLYGLFNVEKDAFLSPSDRPVDFSDSFLFKKLPENMLEEDYPDMSDDDEMSIGSVDGELVVFFEENYYTLSIDTETTTKLVIETLLPMIKVDKKDAELYHLCEETEEGSSRILSLEEIPLINKLNSIDPFKFVLRKTERVSVDEQIDSTEVASKRTMKLAGFFGVEESQSQVGQMQKLLGTSNVPLVKKKTVTKKSIFKEGWLQVRRDFGEIGKARWQQCWCYISKGELVICLDQMSKNESITHTGVYTSLYLNDALISHIEVSKKFVFKVIDSRGIAFEFAAPSINEENEWMNRLKVVSRMKFEETEKALSESKKKTLDDFEFLKVIGRGHFGKVLLCADKESGEVFAIKVLKKSRFVNSKDVKNVITEKRILKGLRHPFVVGLHYAFQSDDRLYLVMEYVNGGELFFHLGREGYFKEERAKFYAAEILLAINHLHKKGVIYRDLKLENLLLDKDGHVKITDFGLCKDELGVGVQTSTICGTTEYMAPEVLLNISYGYPVDWWSYGVVLYEMLCGAHPFYSKSRDQLFYNILHAEIRYPRWISDSAIDLLEGLLERNPSLRFGSGKMDGNEIMKHRFFKGINFDLLEQKKVPPPWKPNVSSAADISNIDEMFTKENPVLTPTEEAPVNIPDFDDFT